MCSTLCWTISFPLSCTRRPHRGVCWWHCVCHTNIRELVTTKLVYQHVCVRGNKTDTIPTRGTALPPFEVIKTPPLKAIAFCWLCYCHSHRLGIDGRFGPGHNTSISTFSVFPAQHTSVSDTHSDGVSSISDLQKSMPFQTMFSFSSFGAWSHLLEMSIEP